MSQSVGKAMCECVCGTFSSSLRLVVKLLASGRLRGHSVGLWWSLEEGGPAPGRGTGLGSPLRNVSGTHTHPPMGVNTHTDTQTGIPLTQS